MQIAEARLQAEEASKTVAELQSREAASAAEVASLQATLSEAERLAEVLTKYVVCLSRACTALRAVWLLMLLACATICMASAD